MQKKRNFREGTIIPKMRNGGSEELESKSGLFCLVKVG